MIPIRTSLFMFDKLQQYPVHTCRMNECDFRVSGAALRRGINEPNPCSLEALKRRLDIVHTNGDMVNAFSTFRHEFLDGRIGTEWLEQLDSAFSNGNHRDADPLFFDILIAGDP